MTDWNHCISTTTMLIATKLGRMVTYRMNLHVPSMRWSCKVTWQIKCIIQKTHGHQTRQGGDLPLETLNLQSHDTLITRPTWGDVITWEIYISTFTDLWPLNLTVCWLRGGGSVRKNWNRHRLLVHISVTLFHYKKIDT